MDRIAFACASKHSQSYCATASVHKVNFLNPIEVGALVTMKASVNYVEKSSMIVGIRINLRILEQEKQSTVIRHTLLWLLLMNLEKKSQYLA